MATQPRIYSALAPSGLPDYEQQKINLAGIQQRQQAFRGALQAKLQERALEMERQGREQEQGFQSEYLDYLRGEGEAKRGLQREQLGLQEQQMGLQERLGMAEIGLSRQQMASLERQAGRKLSLQEKIAADERFLQEQGLGLAESRQAAAEKWKTEELNLRREESKAGRELEREQFDLTRDLSERELTLQEQAQQYQQAMGGMQFSDRYVIDPATGLPVTDPNTGQFIQTEEYELEQQMQRKRQALELLAQLEQYGMATPGNIQSIEKSYGFDVPDDFGKRRDFQEYEVQRKQVRPFALQAGSAFSVLETYDFDNEESWRLFDTAARRFFDSLGPMSVQERDAAIDVLITDPESPLRPVLEKADPWDLGGIGDWPTQDQFDALLPEYMKTRLQEHNVSGRPAAPPQDVWEDVFAQF